MFRRLAEAFQDPNSSGSGGHTDYIKNQNVYFAAVPNIIPSATSGLKGFDKAIQSVEPQINDYQQTFNKYPNDIFMPDSKPGLDKLVKQCASSSLDELIAIKNPNAGLGCGWLYTPPAKNSPYPVLSKGFIGNASGPLDTFSPPDYKKWFFDLQLAKKQILLDKCKALKGCTEVDSDVFKGSCGFCTDTNQGVPIDNVGKPLYGGDPVGTCSPGSIVTSGGRCPPPPEAGSGPQPIVDRTCQPVNGRLSASCLYDRVITAGCSDNGSLAIALSSPASPSDYIANIRNGDAVKIYNRVANPPLKLDVFTQGATTVDAVLKEARQLASNTKSGSNTALGAAARDLCLQSGAIKNYDFCSELSDASQAPFDVVCLQQLFRKLGGQPLGTMYPSTNTMATYNSMVTLGAIKQYWSGVIQNMKSTDYATQREAMIQFLGIKPEDTVKRAPYSQGVEIFSFVQVPGQPNRVIGFLRRTIRNDFLQFGGEVSPNVGSVPAFTNMIQLTDVRAPSNFTTKFSVTIDDGFFVSVNQPANYDAIILRERGVNRPNVFANIGLQGPTTYNSEYCFNYRQGLPNITKMFYEDAGGGGQQFTLRLSACSGTPTFTPPYYSLTCEPRAPFLNFEVNSDTGRFEETRNPGMFEQFIGLTGLEYHMRTEERNSVPGKKSFVRLNSANSCINMPNIAYQSWGTMSFAIRLQTMPVKETIFNFATSNYICNIIASPINGSTAGVYISHNFGNGVSIEAVPTTIQLSLNKWYLFFIHNNGSDLSIYYNSIDEFISNKGQSAGNTRIMASNKIWLPNGTYNPAPGQNQSACNVMFGTKNFTTWREMYSTSSFNYDIAWVHFFEQIASGDDIYRDCMANWVFTQFPDSSGNYKTLG
jgi:hypothetical protein